MIKSIISVATSIGVSQVVHNIMEVTTPANLEKAKKVTTIIGGLAISAVLSSAASEHVEGSYDKVVELFNKSKEGIEEEA